MIKVTADIFSGRPNPQWVVSGTAAKDALRSLSQKTTAVAAIDSGFQGLGNRGLIVEFLEDYIASEYGLPATFRLAGGGSRDESYAHEVAERLIAVMTKKESAKHPALPAAEAGGGYLPLNESLKKFILADLPARAGSIATQMAQQSGTIDEAHDIRPLSMCLNEANWFTPAFWNDPAHIRWNNCYNYATNRRTDTYAQPGLASGHMYLEVNCVEVGDGARWDGGTFKCAPDNQIPRWYMALVVTPPGPHADFHWYRRAREGFWGHKPGQTAARSVDQAGRIVANPVTADRGRYTIFCRFMYAQRKMVVR